MDSRISLVIKKLINLHSVGRGLSAYVLFCLSYSYPFSRSPSAHVVFTYLSVVSSRTHEEPIVKKL